MGTTTEGNLIKKVEPDGAVWTYDSNGAGMLTRVVRPNGHTVEFGYDPLARRIFKKYRGKTTQWLWDGNVPLHEWVERDADAVDEDFTRAPVVDDAVAIAEKQLKAMLVGRPANGPPEQSASAAYLDGGPDSRKEVTAGITLEALQARYEAALARERLETDRMKGVVPVRTYDRDDDQVAADELLGADWRDSAGLRGELALARGTS